MYFRVKSLKKAFLLEDLHVSSDDLQFYMYLNIVGSIYDLYYL